jgi:hypothetical protein
MGVEGLLYYTNCLFSNIKVVLGTLSASYNCNQMVLKTSIQVAMPASIGEEFSEHQLHI